MGQLLSFRTRQEYNTLKFEEMSVADRKRVLVDRTRDTLIGLGRFYKSTGRWTDGIEDVFQGLAADMEQICGELAGEGYEDEPRTAAAGTEAETGKTP